MGAWVTYGLGSLSQGVPTYVVLPDPRGLSPGGVLNWGAGFLPALHEGTVLQTDVAKPPIADLFPPPGYWPNQKNGTRDFLQQLNRQHAAARPENSELEARIAAYGLGFKAAENPAYCYDLHATALHLLGLDHEKLSYYHNGIQRRLTDVHGEVMHDLLS